MAMKAVLDIIAGKELKIGKGGRSQCYSFDIVSAHVRRAVWVAVDTSKDLGIAT